MTRKTFRRLPQTFLAVVALITTLTVDSGMASGAAVWGAATPAEFDTGVQNTAPLAWFNSVSCASAGNCVAVGQFKNTSGYYEAMTMTMVDNTPTPTTTTAPATTTTTTVAATTTTVAATTTTVVVKPFTLKLRQTANLNSVFNKLNMYMAISPQATLTATSLSVKTCVVIGSRVRAVSTGMCMLQVKIVPPSTKAFPKPKARLQVIRFAVTR